MRSLSISLSLAISMTGYPAQAEGVRTSQPTELPASQRIERFAARGYGERPMFAQAAEDEASQVGDIEARIAALESQRDAISTRGPRAAMITGGVLTGVGFGVATLAGVLCAAAAAGSSTQCKTDNAIGIAAGGGVIGIAGLITLFTGRSKLRERNQEREALEHEIQSLESQRAKSAMPTVGFGIGQDQDPGLVLGWRF